MKERPLIQPECQYYFDDYFIQKSELRNVMERGETLTGKVTDIDENRRIVKVKLGEKIFVDMAWEDCSIEPFTYCSNTTSEVTNQIPIQVRNILSRKIRCKVKKIEGNNVYVSRKLNMEEAWKYITTLPQDYVFDAAVRGCNLGTTMVFLDIGEGITGVCYYKDFSFTRIRFADWVKFGQKYRVQRIGDFNYEHFSIECSRKNACKKDYTNFKRCDIVQVRVADEVYDKVDKTFTGYYVEVSPNVRGIANLAENVEPKKYGEIVTACVRKVKPDEKKMSLIIIE